MQIQSEPVIKEKTSKRQLTLLKNGADIAGDASDRKTIADGSNAIAYPMPAKGSFRAAFQEIDITPEVSATAPLLLQGMAGPARRATHVADSLKMQVLLVEDDHFTKILFVTADIIGFSPEMVQTVRTYGADWGIDPAGIILNASHTHYAPGTIGQFPQVMGPYYADYARRLSILIKSCLRNLYFQLETARLSWSFTDATIGTNRRLPKDGQVVFGPNPDAPYDSHTPMILVALEKSGRNIVLVRHSCHPTGLGSAPVVSADYPGQLRKRLLEGGHAHGVMFFQGAAGSSKQTKSFGDGSSSEFADGFDAIKANGDHLAQRIAERLDASMCRIEGNFFAALEHKPLVFEKPPSRLQIQQMAQNANVTPIVRQWAQNLLRLRPQGNFPTQAIMEIQAVRLGNEVTFLTLPGEPSAELSQMVDAVFPSKSPLFFLGYTNGLLGYLPTSQMLLEGGYEGDTSHIAYGWPSKLAQGLEMSVKQFIDTLPGHFAHDARHPVYGRHHEFTKHRKAFFVLSSGRCGTMTMAHVLNTATNARVWHHPQPDPIQEALYAYHDEIEKAEAFWRFRHSVIHQTWSRGLIHGETDLLMTPFAPAIFETLPEAKFVILVRNPTDFVQSGMRRKYYVDHPWDVGRLRPRKDDPVFESWNQRDPFEKVCWLWNETYRKIEDFSRTWGNDRIKWIKLEDLIQKPETFEELFQFIGLDGFNPKTVQGILKRKLNAQKEGDFPPPEQWSSARHDTLWRICGTMADKLGYRPFSPSQIDTPDTAPSIKVSQSVDKTNTPPSFDEKPTKRKGRIAKDSVITCPFHIGSYSNIMGKAIIKGNRACRIGRYCALGWGIHIITSHHDISRANVQIDMQQRHGFKSIWLSNGDVTIGNNVWIGDNAVILSGVTVGDGAVIGAGAIVMNDIPPFAVAAGNPAHVIKMRFSSKIIEQLLEIKWWNWTEEKIARNRIFFEMDLTEDPDLDLFSVIVK